jgi:3-phosphoshikimate 1-carboxyvinyltransferase
MKVTIQPSHLKGHVFAPASKSSMQRACAAALLAKGRTIIQNPGHSNDDKAALGIVQSLGATTELVDGCWQVDSNGIDPAGTKINCGESGLSIRMFASIAALSEKEISIVGEGSLLSRPMDFFDTIFPKLQVNIKSNDGKLPLSIHGPLQPADIKIDGSLSSQFLTGLLFAYAAADARGVTIKVNDLKSRPYIDLTFDVMKQYGLKVPENRSYSEFYFSTESHQLQQVSRTYTVEGDWSGGAFLLVAGSIAGPIEVRGLDLASTQADKAVIDALMSANAGISMDAKSIQLTPSAMNAFEFDATDCPDLFPPLVALAAYCQGTTSIKGVTRLAHKESNRAVTLQEEFGKMGVRVDLNGNIMQVHGGKPVRGAIVHSRHDHRIAMACAVAALKAGTQTTIEQAQAIKKSYPDFYSDLEKLGAGVSLSNKIRLHE